MKAKISKHRAQIMGLSIILIYYMHIFTTQKENSLGELIQRFSFIGVDFFVALSMFGLYHSFEKNPVDSPISYFRYLRKRLLRIYAIFLPVTVIMMLIDNWSILTFIKRLFLIEQITVNLYKHLWFIPGIILFYVFAPFCYKAVKKVRNVPLLTVIVFLLVYVILFLFHKHIRPDANAVLARIPDIFIGFMLATYDDSLDTKNNRIYFATILITFIIGVAIMFYEVIFGYFNIFHGDNIIHNNLTTPGFIIALALLFELLSSKNFTRFINSALESLGSITLEIYCIHEWIWKYISALQIKDSKKHLACIIIVLICSWGLHKLGSIIKNGINKSM